MQINSLLQSAATQPTARGNTSKTTGPIESSAATRASADQLDLSPEAQALSQSQASGRTEGGIRVDKVAAIRQAIAGGNYETPQKLDAALDRLLDTFA